MSSEVNWNIDVYREEHESEDHWQLRRSFMERWKDCYDEERLVCLARVFANIEFLGCRYPNEVMQEVAKLSKELAKDYRQQKKTKLQRTFVSASDAAEDRAKGIKREGGVILDQPRAKTSRILFVKPQETPEDKSNSQNEQTCSQTENQEPKHIDDESNDIEENISLNRNHNLDGLNYYMKEMSTLKCMNIRGFRESMFYTDYGRMVMLIRPWASKLANIQASFQACKLLFQSKVDNLTSSLLVNGKLLAQATADTKQEAKINAVNIAWDRLVCGSVSVLVKQQWIAQHGARVTHHAVTRDARDDVFGTPVDNTVATKMMKMMGWSGGGLGADEQGIAEPIKPHLQMVNRAGLGSCSNLREVRARGLELMRRYACCDTLDVDLVFSEDFSKTERAELHHLAKRSGLASKSIGHEPQRFLVVRKKIDPFSIVRAVIEKGGDTPKYQVFIPETLKNR